MNDLSQHSREAEETMDLDGRRGFTLVELLTSIGIALILMAMLFPALTAAREASRNVTCKNNLRQLGVGLQDNAALEGTYCTGAFDWFGDGCVTEIGWVADLVNKGVSVGKMLCPSNPAKISETYYDLLAESAVVGGPNVCSAMGAKVKGSEPYSLPDGTLVYNPCGTIITKYADPSALSAQNLEKRRLVVEQEVYDKFYNTNYTASWFLVRMGVDIDGTTGNLRHSEPGCGTVDPTNVFCTQGPLEQTKLDLLDAPANLLPLLGCGGMAADFQPMVVGEVNQSSPLAKSFTDGPRLTSDIAEVPEPGAISKDGASGWWAYWNTTLQDYRGFGPVHRSTCNLLFADGSVRSVKDSNRDGYLNNGFSTISQGGFLSNDVEMPLADVFSRWSLEGPFPD